MGNRLKWAIAESICDWLVFFVFLFYEALCCKFALSHNSFYITGVPALKRSELETACEDFSNIIGSLSDCKLYKGTLSSGVEIAVVSTVVTSAKDWSKQSESQFRKKVPIIHFFLR